MKYYDKILEVILPNALMIGVDYELFWTLNPKTLSPFIKAFSMKQKYDDGLAWNAGRYIQLAIASNLGKEVKYPSKPFMSDATSKKEPEVMSSEEIKRRMLAKMNRLNPTFEKGD